MLYIIYRNTDLIDYILKGIYNRTDIRFVPINELRFHFLQRIIYFVDRNFSVNINPKVRFSKTNLTLFKEIMKDDTILLFDFDLLIDIKFIKEHVKTNNINLWLWNTLGDGAKSYLEVLSRHNIGVFTFDPKDSKLYNIQLLNQVYNIESRPFTECEIDFFFIGKDKGRAAELNNLVIQLREYGYSVKFVVFNKKANSQFSQIEHLNKHISYAEILNLIQKSNCIVDITKEQQEGITLRVLESVSHKKKLISNNREIENTDLYNENNVLFLPILTFGSLVAFLEKEYMPISSDILKKYHIDSWIRFFLDKDKASISI